MKMPTVSGRARIALMVIAAIALQALVIHHLRASGLIDKLIPWDDCTYIYTGISNAFSIEHGFWNSLEYAHSPLSIIPSTIVALVTSQSGTAPYWVNVLYLIGLFVLIERWLKNYRLSSVIAFSMVMVTTPFIFVFASHVKTDFHGGILFFALLSLLFKPDDEGESPFWLVAVLSVLILLAKPMAFYLPILLTAVFVLSAFNRCVASGRMERYEISRHAMLALVSMIAYALLVLPNLSFFKEYIAQTLLPMWASGLPFRLKLAYYLPFVDIGQLDNPDRFGFWGRNYVSFLVIIVAFVLSIRKSSVWRPAILLLAAAVTALIPAVISPHQQWAFGSLFAGSVMALLFYMLRAVQKLEKAGIVNWLVIVASLVVFSIPVAKIQTWVPHDPQSLAQAKAITEDFVSRMDPHQPDNPPYASIFFPFSGPIPDFDFGIRYYKQYQKLLSGFSESYVVDSSIIDDGLGKFSYVVMFGDKSKLSSFTESNRNLDAYQKKIKDRWNLKEISSLPYAGTTYTLYRVISKKVAP